jgi:hypothetical protein
MKHRNHSLHYIDLHPAPLDDDTPSPWCIIGGAVVFAALMYLLVVLAFSL